MPPFAMLLKSYAGDLEYATRMVASLRAFNTDGVHLFAVVPAVARPLFARLASDDLTLIDEEELGSHLVDREVHGLRPGYINQEIVKLAWWQLGLADNLFTVDSDAQFIRPFGVSDFMHPDGSPYSILVEDRDLAVDPVYFRTYWPRRAAEHRLLWETVGIDDPVIRTCHGHTTFSRQVLESFHREFLEPRGWTYADALELSPYEYTWYNAWLLKQSVVPVHPRDPVVKVYHHEEQYISDLALGVTLDDLARGYLAVVINANFSRDKGMLTMPSGSAKVSALAEHLSYGETLSLLQAKAANSARRLRGTPPR